MLGDSKVLVQQEDKVVEKSVKEVYEMFCNATKDGKRLSILVKSYNPLKKTWAFRPIKNIKPSILTSKIKRLTLDFSDIEKDKVAHIFSDVQVKLLTKTHKDPTLVTVGFFTLGSARLPEVAFVDGENVVYKKLLKVEDYRPEVVIEQATTKKKRGRPKVQTSTDPKAGIIQTTKPLEVKVYALELDTGYVAVCDNLLVR